MTQEFKLNETVWAKIKGFEPWPGKIIELIDNNKAKIYFFGDKKHACLSFKHLSNFKENFDLYSDTKNLRKREAINQARALLNLPPKLYPIIKQSIIFDSYLSTSHKKHEDKEEVLSNHILSKGIIISKPSNGNPPKITFTFENEENTNDSDDSGSNNEDSDEDISKLSMFDLLTNTKYLNQFLQYLKYICTEIDSNQLKGFNKEQKEVLLRMFWILAQYKFSSAELLEKSSELHLFVSYIDKFANNIDNAISLSAKDVIANLSHQYMKSCLIK